MCLTYRPCVTFSLSALPAPLEPDLIVASTACVGSDGAAASTAGRFSEIGDHFKGEPTVPTEGGVDVGEVGFWRAFSWVGSGLQLGDGAGERWYVDWDQDGRAMFWAAEETALLGRRVTPGRSGLDVSRYAD